jgi:ferritin-like metal-binding protein YciE
MKNPTLNKLFEDQLADTYYAEKQIVKALPKMAKASMSEELRDAFNDHLEETKGHVARLEAVFELVGKKARAKKCEAIEGIIKESVELAEEYAGSPSNDAALICAAQKVEHYEMANYGTLAAWADQLDLKEAADHLRLTLKEESGADEKLSKLALSGINEAAESASAA